MTGIGSSAPPSLLISWRELREPLSLGYCRMVLTDVELPLELASLKNVPVKTADKDT